MELPAIKWIVVGSVCSADVSAIIERTDESELSIDRSMYHSLHFDWQGTIHCFCKNPPTAKDGF